MNKTNKKDIIILKSLSLFSSKGYDHVSVQEIVESIGITKPTLYYYFGNKEGVIKSIFEKHYNEMNQLLKEASIYNPNPNSYDHDVLPVLIKVVNVFFHYAQTQTEFFIFHLSLQHIPPSYELFRLADQFLSAQQQILKEMFDSFASVHSNMRGRENRYCVSFIGMVNVYIELWLKQKIVLNPELAEELVKQFMHGIFS